MIAAMVGLLALEDTKYKLSSVYRLDNAIVDDDSRFGRMRTTLGQLLYEQQG